MKREEAWQERQTLLNKVKAKRKGLAPPEENQIKATLLTLEMMSPRKLQRNSSDTRGQSGRSRTPLTTRFW